MIAKDIEDAFFRGEPHERFRFGINTTILVVAGPHAGVRGSVISLLHVDPEPTYLVENGKDGSLVVVESALRALGHEAS